MILDGGGIHDVIGTRCDPFTHSLLSGGTIPVHTCHQNLINALEDFLAYSDLEMEKLVEQSFKSSSSGSITFNEFYRTNMKPSLYDKLIPQLYTSKINFKYFLFFP